MTLPSPISFLGVVLLAQSTHGEKKISSRLAGVASLPNTLPVSERTRCLQFAPLVNFFLRRPTNHNSSKLLPLGVLLAQGLAPSSMPPPCLAVRRGQINAIRVILYG